MEYILHIKISLGHGIRITIGIFNQGCGPGLRYRIPQHPCRCLQRMIRHEKQQCGEWDNVLCRENHNIKTCDILCRLQPRHTNDVAAASDNQ